MTDDNADGRQQEHDGLLLTHWGRPPPTVLLIHGHKVDSRIWGSFARRLATDAHVVAVDWNASNEAACVADLVNAVGKVVTVLDRADVVVAEREAAAAAVDLALRGFTLGVLLISPTSDVVLPEADEEETAASGSGPRTSNPREGPEEPAGSEESDELLAALSEVIEHPDRGIELMIDFTSRGYVQFVSAEDAPLIRPILEKYFRAEPPVLAVSEPRWVDRLRDVAIPVIVTWPSIYRGTQEKAIVALASQGEGIPIDAHITMPWLEQPDQTIALIRRLLREVRPEST